MMCYSNLGHVICDLGQCCAAIGLPYLLAFAVLLAIDTAAAVAALGGSANGESELVALVQWQQTIEAAEQQWGPSHPAVGRAWLELARVWQATDKENDRAKYATKKAFDICQILLQQTAMVSH